jgi:hypothetical protein
MQAGVIKSRRLRQYVREKTGLKRPLARLTVDRIVYSDNLREIIYADVI